MRKVNVAAIGREAQGGVLYVFRGNDLHVAFAGQMAQPQGFMALIVDHVGKVIAIGRHGTDARIVGPADSGDLDALKRLGAGEENQAVNAESGGGKQDQYDGNDDSQTGFMLARSGDNVGAARAVPGEGDGCARNRNVCGIGNLETSRFSVAPKPLEVAYNFARGLVPQIAILLQQLVDDVFQLGRHCRVQPYWRNRGSIEDTVEDGR